MDVPITDSHRALAIIVQGVSQRKAAEILAAQEHRAITKATADLRDQLRVCETARLEVLRHLHPQRRE